MSNWILQSGKTIGRDHIRNNTVCQDDVKTFERNGVSVIALSDGCGSAPFAEHGSAVTVDFLCSVLVECFDEIFDKDELDIKKYIHSKLIERLTAYILKNKELVQSYKKNNPEHFDRFLNAWPGYDKVESIYPLKLFDATVQFVATKNGKTLIGRLGDGFIGEVSDSKLRILSSEDKNGREGNETVYPSTILLGLTKTETAWKHFEIIKNKNDTAEMYFIVSDGVGYAVIADTRDFDDYQFGEPIEKWVDNECIEEMLCETDFNAYLENKIKPVKGATDDLSIAVLRKSKVSFDTLVVREYDDKENTKANNKEISIGRLISIDSTPHNIKIDSVEEIVLEEYPTFENYENLLDEKQVERIHKLCGDDVEKKDYIIKNLSIIKDKLSNKKFILFNEVLDFLKPYVEDVDLVMLLEYGKKVKLLKFDAKSEEISLFGKK